MIGLSDWCEGCLFDSAHLTVNHCPITVTLLNGGRQPTSDIVGGFFPSPDIVGVLLSPDIVGVSFTLQTLRGLFSLQTLWGSFSLQTFWGRVSRHCGGPSLPDIEGSFPLQTLGRLLPLFLLSTPCPVICNYLPSGTRQSPAAKRILVNFEVKKIKHFSVLKLLMYYIV